MNAKFDLVIFDCDGVLVDSEPIALDLLRRTLEETGLDLPIETVRQTFQGRSMAGVVAAANVGFGHVVEIERLWRMQGVLLEELTERLRPIAGMAGLLRRLDAKRCVASSSNTKRLRHSLATVGFLEAFGSAVFSADEVASGKPAPDLFLHAAKTMGVPPSRCVVVEDSPVGIEAGLAAGMRTIGFTGGGHAVGQSYRQRLVAAGASEIAVSASELDSMLR